MRLMQKDLKPVHLFTSKEVQSDYVGNVEKWEYTNTVQCNVQPADNKITAEIYGKRVHDMISLLCPLDCGITEDTRLSLAEKDKPTYEIKSIKYPSTHISVLAEKLTLKPYESPENGANPENNAEPEQSYGFYPR